MLIQIRSLRKNYDQQAVIDDVSFDIMKGEIFGIVGKSGVENRHFFAVSMDWSPSPAVISLLTILGWLPWTVMVSGV